MDRQTDRSCLDLDRAAAHLLGRKPVWLARGLSTDPLTWADNDAAWPRPLLTERDRVRRPRSLGVRIHDDNAEAQIVIYAAGWYDAEYSGGDQVIDEHTELDDIDELVSHIDRIVARLANSL